VRNEALLDEQSRRGLETVLAASTNLRTVYQFKQQLQGLWQRSAETHEAMVQALQDWCRRAEAAGISSLREFARSLRGYTLTSA
jgi:stearoyl-CoA desaturase (delta-9 desaturase)